MRFVFSLWLMVCPLCSQFETKLEQPTVTAFDSYVRSAEQSLDNRWSGREPFLSLNASTDDSKKLLKGDLLVRPAVSPNPQDAPDGLIHDWVGAVYIANTSVDRVVAVLQDFDRHAAIYPGILRSRLVSRQGNDIKGYWRLQRKQQMVPAIFDVQDEAHYQQLAPGKWICRSHASEIREAQGPDAPPEKDFPAGQGLGLLWRLTAYWSIEARGSGVFAECRTISLSRGIPSGMGWMIRPFIQNVPRESLSSTLLNTRKALKQ